MTFVLAESLHADVATLYAVYRARPRRDDEAFRDLFKAAIRAVHAGPRQHPLVDDEYPGREVRECYIKRFSQRVLYFIKDDRLVVFALLHASRRPGAWHRRLDTVS